VLLYRRHMNVSSAASKNVLGCLHESRAWCWPAQVLASVREGDVPSSRLVDGNTSSRCGVRWFTRSHSSEQLCLLTFWCEFINVYQGELNGQANKEWFALTMSVLQRQESAPQIATKERERCRVACESGHAACLRGFHLLHIFVCMGVYFALFYGEERAFEK